MGRSNKKKFRKYLVVTLPLLFSFSFSQGTSNEFTTRRGNILQRNCLKNMHLIDVSVKEVTPEFLNRLSESEKDTLKRCIANNGNLKK